MKHRKVTHQAIARDGSILTRTSDAINTPDGLRYRWVVVTLAGDGPHGAATWHGTAELARASARGFSAFESYILPVTLAAPKPRKVRPEPQAPSTPDPDRASLAYIATKEREQHEASERATAATQHFARNPRS